HLDAKVGKGRYVLVLTADHGVCPLPEVARAKGKDSRRGPSAPAQAEDLLDEKVGQGAGGGPSGEAEHGPGGYPRPRRGPRGGRGGGVGRRGLEVGAVEEALAAWLRAQPTVAAAYTRTQLLRGVPEGDAVGQAVRRSFHPDRCGEVAVVTKPYYLVSPEPGTG